MEILVIALAALVASGLTLFSGFGLGTLLMPVVALFFPLNVAISITAIVHFTNNLFKLGLVGFSADKVTVVKFGLPAVVAALAGALVLAWLSDLQPLHQYELAGRTLLIMPVKVIVGALIIGFVILESLPAFAAIKLNPGFLPLGGCISGFFGGLSGHQGALRSMFLIKAGLSKERFIATGVVLSVMVDFTRLLIYGWDARTLRGEMDWLLVVVATLAAFAGAFIGSRLVRKITIRSIQVIVSFLLVVVALGLMAGVL
ncbi:MAG TPA: sulfite exporter TauE/SafE family protein [Prosthecobacter sp.]|nr:sulfite exporter TauE/SafE family protein [Prosthecobacter sp.]